MGDDDHPPSELLDAQGKRSQSFAVEVVRGLVEDEQVWPAPHGGGQHQLDLYRGQKKKLCWYTLGHVRRVYYHLRHEKRSITFIGLLRLVIVEIFQSFLDL